MASTAPITVFFDGFCPVCSREVRLYRRLQRRGAICWRDLAADPDVLRNEPFGLAEALTLLHVRDGDGTLQIGLDAHLSLWACLPGFSPIVFLVRRFSLIRRLLNAIYLDFTRRRPGLRRRTARASHE